MNSNKSLPKPPLYTKDYLAMADRLNDAQFGALVRAIMQYVDSGTLPEKLPLELNLVFGFYQSKIAAAREKYERLCETNAENGKNGGRPRKQPPLTTPEAETSEPPKPKTGKKSPNTPKIKMPPSKEQFTTLIEQRQADGLISTECVPAEFFEWAEILKWKVNGEPAESVGDFLEYAAARHPTEKVAGKIPPEMRGRLGKVYGDIFKKFHGLRDTDGNTCALTAAIDFLSAYDGGWSIHGKTFSDDNWLDALAEFMKELKTR